MCISFHGVLPDRTGRIDIAESINCLLSCEVVVCVFAARGMIRIQNSFVRKLTSANLMHSDGVCCYRKPWMADAYDLLKEVQKALLTCDAASMSEVDAVQVVVKDIFL